MLTRILLIVAIVAGLGAGALNFTKVKEKVTTLKTSLDTETAAHQEFLGKYNTTKADLEKTNAVLKTTQETLKATEEEKTKALAEASAQQKRAEKLTDDLNKTRGERDAAQQELAQYKASGMTPEQVAGAAKQIKSLQTAMEEQQIVNNALNQQVRKLTNALAMYEKQDFHVKLPPTLKG